jgi:hypothetical protein
VSGIQSGLRRATSPAPISARPKIAPIVTRTSGETSPASIE